MALVCSRNFSVLIHGSHCTFKSSGCLGLGPMAFSAVFRRFLTLALPVELGTKLVPEITLENYHETSDIG